MEFAYYPADSVKGLLRSIRTPSQTWSDSRDSLQYDRLGNLSRAKTPLGFWTTHYADAVGRDTLELSPIDSAQTLFQRTRIQYDLSDRDTLGVTIGPQMPGSIGHPPDTLFMRKVYDPEDNVITVTRRASPELGVDRVCH